MLKIHCGLDGSSSKKQKQVRSRIEQVLEGQAGRRIVG